MAGVVLFEGFAESHPLPQLNVTVLAVNATAFPEDVTYSGCDCTSWTPPIWKLRVIDCELSVKVPPPSTDRLIGIVSGLFPAPGAVTVIVAEYVPAVSAVGLTLTSKFCGVWPVAGETDSQLAHRPRPWRNNLVYRSNC